MSFTSEIKEYLNSIQEKHPCCISAYRCGLESRELISSCERDSACFLRGVFVRCGFVSPPGGSNGLTLTFSDDYIFYVNAVLDSVGIEAKIGRRRNKLILYYKESERIEDFLALIGASKFALKLMEQKIIKELRGNANRICNAETANLDRAAKAAAEQCGAINLLIANREYSTLSTELRECADLRLVNPDMSLDELRLLCDPPISKSGLNHRFKRLIMLADQIKQRK
ncbi:MAG: DNA-binding protein WhiA [Firmicutes bacterium HGW-Firmicutes-21]|nr:MAG: DNA-binding protein WhiA [Firmicutes bacterium HGW-Firmicutes-21]